MQIIKQAEEMARGHRIERLADVIIAGDAPDLEQRTGIIAALGHFHVLLEAQEGGALGEEDREGPEGDVGHVELSVVAGAPVGEVGRDGAPALG